MGLTIPARPVSERIKKFIKVNEETGCHEFTGGKNVDGYGHIWVNELKRTIVAHRAMWRIKNGEIPDGLLVLHKCDNKPCCNPDHLFLGTTSDNMKDMTLKKKHWCTLKTHCKRGHALTEENVYRYPGVHLEHRFCKTCMSDRQKGKYKREA